MTFPDWGKNWREAAVWALAAAFLFEGGCNVFARRTIWHRLADLEHSVQELQHERELDERDMRHQFDELRQKAQRNEEQVEKVEEKVEKKKEHKP